MAPHENAATSSSSLLPFQAAAKSSRVSECTLRNFPFRLMTHTWSGSGIGDETSDRTAGMMPLVNVNKTVANAMETSEAEGERRNRSFRSPKLLLIETQPECRGKGAPTESSQFQLSIAGKLIGLCQEVAPVPHLPRPTRTPVCTPRCGHNPTGQPDHRSAAGERSLDWSGQAHDFTTVR